MKTHMLAAGRLLLSVFHVVAALLLLDRGELFRLDMHLESSYGHKVCVRDINSPSLNKPSLPF